MCISLTEMNASPVFRVAKESMAEHKARWRRRAMELREERGLAGSAPEASANFPDESRPQDAAGNPTPDRTSQGNDIL